ncbi:MAG: DSD1 family PLP-dependent enzyme [Bacteroidetes bacterium]|nr:DSD1 family PLP-dependent enzyme [Bacteroidota bacterium]
MYDQPDMVGRSKWDLDTPALLVDLSTMERNIERMTRTFRQAGVSWRPHTKGQKVPAIALKEIAAGAIGVTCAKLGEAEAMAAAGIRDILIANEIVGPQKIARLLSLLPEADPIVAVDDEDNLRALDRAARERGLRPRVVVEVNVGANRAGVQPGQAALALSRQANDCKGLRYVGLMGWEGHTVTIRDPEAKRDAIEHAVGLLTDSARLCREAGLPVAIVSCGGTGTYRTTAFLPGVTEIQAGGGIFCDVYYRHAMGVDHEYALTVLTTVSSRPSLTRITCDAGKKAMSSDAGVPEPLGLSGVAQVRLVAEHALIDLQKPNVEIRVGDKVEFVIGYSDTTVCLHDEMYGIRNGRVEAVWPILARSKYR